MKKMLVTGSSGLIGSEVCAHFGSKDYAIHGIDNNMRAIFFGPQGDTRGSETRLTRLLSHFHHHEVDIRDRHGVMKLVKELRPDVIVHTAAQPSHDLAAKIPFDDFDTNAVGTLNLLEALRQCRLDAPFIHMSTNKVYGDSPNCIPLIEFEKRWDYARPEEVDGIDECQTIDQSKHSLFGASKVAGDVMVQEYGRYFGMPTVCLRGGCLTGPNHAGVELHGFLSYLVKCCLEGKTYNIYGYKGKQVRDNIHSFDVVRFIEEYLDAPRPAEVYNIGGGRENSCSIWEAFEMAEAVTTNKMKYEYVDKNREGDHICYISNLNKMKEHYPRWQITKDLKSIFSEIAHSWKERNAS